MIACNYVTPRTTWLFDLKSVHDMPQGGIDTKVFSCGQVVKLELLICG